MEDQITSSRRSTTTLVVQLAQLGAQLRESRRRKVPRRSSSQSARRSSPSASGPPTTRSDVAPRVLPVGRVVRRPPDRDELLRRCRPAGQGARDQIAATRRRSRRSIRPSSTRRQDRGPAGPDRRPEGEPRQEPGRPQDAKDGTQEARAKTAKALARQKATYAKLDKNKAAAKKAMDSPSRRRRSSRIEIAELIRKQIAAQKAAQARAMAEARCGRPRRGARSSRHTTGRCVWPMAGGFVTPAVRLHRLRVGAAARRVRPLPPGHRHCRAVRARRSRPPATGRSSTSAGTTPTARTRPGSSSSPTATGLQTWYAHMQPRYPGGISAGSHVEQGQVIGYEGNTGHSTGAHLHWAVMLNGDFVNPRLFL